MVGRYIDDLLEDIFYTRHLKRKKVNHAVDQNVN